jgi:hypothetical protein
MTSIEEKEKRVLKLLEEGRTFKEIAQIEHMSFSFISIVNKKRLGKDQTINKKQSIPTQALKLFSEGKSVIDVIIVLDRPSAEIRNYYYDYLRLRNMTQLVSLIVSYKESLPTIIKLVSYLIQNPSTKENLLESIKVVKEFPRLKALKKQLENKIQALRHEGNCLSDGYNSSGGINQY